MEQNGSCDCGKFANMGEKKWPKNFCGIAYIGCVYMLHNTCIDNVWMENMEENKQDLS